MRFVPVKALRLAWMGLGNLPGYGPHPGIPAMSMIAVMPIIVISPDWIRVLICEAAVWLTFGVIFLVGSYQRADEYLRNKANAGRRTGE